MHKINGVYLSGWEYNRLLDSDACTSGRNSALPGDILWNGSAQLWLFERIYCTAEALENEREAGRRLNWTTGKIFAELADRERWLEPIDWSADFSVKTRSAINAKKDELAQNADVRGWIASKDVEKLETTKAVLLEPALTEKNAVLGVSPSSLRHWQLPANAGISQDALLLRRFYTSLEKPLAQQSAGLRLCRKPKATPEQLWVTEHVEAPNIDDLVAGEGDFAGRGGYANYHKLLEPHLEKYSENDNALWADWQQSKERLKRLRGAAAKYIWHDLHTDWLPALLREREAYLEEFQKWITSALRHRPIAELFNMNTLLMVGVANPLTQAVSAVLGQFVGLDSPSIYTVGVGGIGTLAATWAHVRLTRKRHNVGSLALFYQKAAQL